MREILGEKFCVSTMCQRNEVHRTLAVRGIRRGSVKHMLILKLASVNIERFEDGAMM